MLLIHYLWWAHPHFETHFGTFSTSFTKFGTSFIKIGTTIPNSTKTLILSPMVHYVIWELIRKWLEVNPHLGMHFGTLGTRFTKFGTSFIKFGTSNPISTRTHILSPMVHYFIFESIRKWLEVDPHLRTHFETLGTSLIKFGTSILNVIGTPILSPMVHYFIWEPIRKWLEVDPYLDRHFETPGTSFTKFGTSFLKFCTSNPITTETPILSPTIHYFI